MSCIFSFYINAFILKALVERDKTRSETSKERCVKNRTSGGDNAHFFTLQSFPDAGEVDFVYLEVEKEGGEAKVNKIKCNNLHV